MSIQVGGVMLYPLGRADQTLLFGVPRRVDDRPCRPLTCVCERGDGLRFREHCDQSRYRVRRAVVPGIVVIASYDPLVGVLAAFQARNHIIDRDSIPVEREPQAHPRGTRAQVVGNRQCAVPLLGHNGAPDRRQQRQCIAIGDRQHGNFG